MISNEKNKELVMNKLLSVFIAVLIMSFNTAQGYLLFIKKEGNKPNLIDLTQQSLLANKIGLNEKDELGNTPLTIAASNGNDKLVRFLIKSGADINLQGSLGTPLISAVFNKQAIIVRLLLQAKANPNIKSTNGVTPLMSASWRMSRMMVDELLKAGADANQKTPDGENALSMLEDRKKFQEKEYQEIKSILQAHMKK